MSGSSRDARGQQLSPGRVTARVSGPRSELPAAPSQPEELWGRATEILWEEMRSDPPWKWILRRLGLQQVSMHGWRDGDGTTCTITGKGPESHLLFGDAAPMQWTFEPVVVEWIFGGDRLAAERELVAIMLDEAAAAYLLADFRTRVVDRWRAEGLPCEGLGSIGGSGPIVNTGTLAGTPDWMAHDDTASPQELMAMLVESGWPEALSARDRQAPTLLSGRLPPDSDQAVDDDEGLDAHGRGLLTKGCPGCTGLEVCRACAIRWTDQLWGDRRGWAMGALGFDGTFVGRSYKYPGGLRHVAHRWPAEKDAFLDTMLLAAPTADVFICPLLRSGPSRRKETSKALQGRYAWADADQWDEARQAVLDVAGVNVLRVSSGGGTGGEHLYIDLAKDCEAEDIVAYNARLQIKLGTDGHGGDNKLLRLPGTFNHKPRAAGAVSGRVCWV